MASGGNKVPERLVNFRVYNNSNDLLGIATVDLPEIEAMSDTVSGAGIAGEVESAAMKLAQQKAHAVEVRGSQQVYDAANGTYSTVPVRCALRVVPKTVTLGTFEPGATTDTEQVFEVLYIKLFVSGKEVLEIDKFNYVAKFGDHDALASVRSDLGLK